MTIKIIKYSCCKQNREIIDGKELKRLRVLNGWTLKDVSDALHISKSYLSDIEHNRRISPTNVVEFFKEAA